MGFETLIRSGVKLANSLTSSLQVTVKLEAWRGQDAFGAPVYARPQALTALLERENHRVKGSDGQSVTIAATKVTFLQALSADGTAGRVEPVDPRDRITFPDGVVHRIVDVKGFIDSGTSLPYLVEVWVE